ncbi:PTS lactose/cellobiose transporter subunit IIA [Clostridium sp. OS1-26]|uniref:PTS lactose/cellobiose transporter subunit IIA n=1 Tax=Clostridium sp. OS1-26 TaxID=3070681 RepID=UPI0027E1A273|nr:PTS lactose/cellobiose transporter subunit IIA [Clostridium sp. OS1-26]WML34842.1 PTS lactose/cellobiose transporter subunit IIA [Clostridium sp. OS1-26]
MELEQIVFNIISHAGSAKSICFEALNLAKKGEFKEAENLINKAKEELYETHGIQNTMIQKEALGQKQEVTLLLMHAEDHLMNAMLAKDLIVELIDMYKLNYSNRR